MALLRDRLHILERSVAVQWVLRYWSFIERHLPAGSRRRRRYQVLRSLVAGWLPHARDGWRGTAKIPVEDFWDELREFARARDRSPVVVLFSATQLREDEGQRPTHFALDLARRGLTVVFCYWRWHAHERCAQDRVRSGILQLPIDVVATDPDRLADTFSSSLRIGMFAFPHPILFPVAASLNGRGWITLYDVLDDWEEFHRVGQAVWYDRSFEQNLAISCDAVYAVNQSLAEHVVRLTGRDAEIVGNGVRAGFAPVERSRPVSRSAAVIGYFGYLAAAWFDWSLVARAARLRPEWTFQLIGYGGEPAGISLPANVRLLGRKPHSELPAHASAWDVAIVPFKQERLASGADPIKTYEYLALGLPVVTTGVAPPPGAERHVQSATTLEEFVRAIERALCSTAADVESRRSFAAGATWTRRVDALLAAMAEGRQRIAEKRALFAALT